MSGDLLWSALLGDFPPFGVPFLPPDQDRPDHQGRRRLALVLAYDGTGFAGWQVQPGRRTVQGVVEEALSRLCHHPVRLQASGRTDTGVHAWGQVAHFTTTSRLPLDRMRRGLAALLPPEVHLRALGAVPPGFHARYSARAKTYHYYLMPRAQATVFLRHRLWALRQELDPQAVEAVLSLLRGEVDLRAFASRLHEGGDNTVRRVYQARLEAQGPVWRVVVTASGFLHHVVRNLVGCAVQAGQGRLSPQAVAEMIAARRRLYSGPRAPAAGLYLARG